MNKNILFLTIFSAFSLFNALSAMDPNREVVPLAFFLGIPLDHMEQEDENKNAQPCLPDGVKQDGDDVLVAQHTHNYGHPCYNEHCGYKPTRMTHKDYMKAVKQNQQSPNPVKDLLTRFIKNTEKATFLPKEPAQE